jgi:hypothetical protein
LIFDECSLPCHAAYGFIIFFLLFSAGKPLHITVFLRRFSTDDAPIAAVVALKILSKEKGRA